MSKSVLSIRLLRSFIWAATRKHHFFDLPTMGHVHELMDHVEFSDAYEAVVGAYIAGQPKSKSSQPREEHERPSFSWEQFLEVAVHSGLKPAEFWSMTPRDVDLWVEGVRARDDREGLMHAHFWSIYTNSNKRKGSAPKKARDLWPEPKKEEEYKPVHEIKSERRETMATLKQQIPRAGASRKHRKA